MHVCGSFIWRSNYKTKEDVQLQVFMHLMDVAYEDPADCYHLKFNLCRYPLKMKSILLILRISFVKNKQSGR